MKRSSNGAVDNWFEEVEREMALDYRQEVEKMAGYINDLENHLDRLRCHGEELVELAKQQFKLATDFSPPLSDEELTEKIIKISKEYEVLLEEGNKYLNFLRSEIEEVRKKVDPFLADFGFKEALLRIYSRYEDWRRGQPPADGEVPGLTGNLSQDLQTIFHHQVQAVEEVPRRLVPKELDLNAPRGREKEHERQVEDIIFSTRQELDTDGGLRQANALFGVLVRGKVLLEEESVVGNDEAPNQLGPVLKQLALSKGLSYKVNGLEMSTDFSTPEYWRQYFQQSFFKQHPEWLTVSDLDTSEFEDVEVDQCDRILKLMLAEDEYVRGVHALLTQVLNN